MALVHEPAHPDIHDDAEREEAEEDRRSGVAHQRKRDSGDRHQAHDHAYIDRNLEEHDSDDPHDDEGTGQVGGGLSVLNQAHEDADGADEAVLLAEGGEDKVGIGDGEEVALSLGAAIGSLAPDSAGTNSDQGLPDLVAGAAGVLVRVHEAGEAGLLVRLQQLAGLPDAADEKEHAEQDDGSLFELDAAEEEAADEDRQVGERGAEVRLLEHHQHRDADEGEGFGDVLPCQFPAREPPEVARYGNDEDQLDPLGGLEVAAGDLDPAARPQDLRSDGQHGYQREDADAISVVNDVEEPVVVDQRNEEHQDDADDEEADLFLVEAVELGVERRRFDLEDADQREQQDEAEEDPVEVAVGGEAGHDG